MMQLWHYVKVHTVYASDKGERDEDGSDRGKHFHGLVHPLAQGSVVDIGEAL